MLDSKLKYSVRTVRPKKDGVLWLPEKKANVARILFSDRADRAADIIFFSDYPWCFRLRLYSPLRCIDFDFSLLEESGYIIRPVCHVFSGVWSELVTETLQRGGILEKRRRYMKILKPGDPCPCCGRPIPASLSSEKMLLLSWIAEGMNIRRAVESMAAEGAAEVPNE